MMQKRLLCGMLVAILFLGLFASTVIAADFTPDETEHCFLQVDDKLLYYREHPGAVDSDVSGASYNHDTRTLTLSGYNGSNIFSHGIPSLTIVLNGKNSITANGQANPNGSALEMMRKDNQKSDLVITGNGSLTVNRDGKKKYVAVGVQVSGSVQIMDGSKVTVNVKNGPQVHGFNCRYGNLKVDTARGSSLTVQAKNSKGMITTLSLKLPGGKVTTTGSAILHQGDHKNLCRVVKRFTMDGWNSIRSPYFSITKRTSVKTVSLNMRAKQLRPRQSVRLKTELLPNNASDKTITWKSSNTSVAKVASNGRVTAVGNGKCTITAKAHNGKKATCSVIVSTSKRAVKSVVLTKKTATLSVGDSLKLKPRVNPVKATERRFICTSSNPDVATVDKKGVVTAMGVGTCKITVTSYDGGKTSICTVQVIDK